MTTITVQRTVSMGHRLPSYDGLCSSPHGHNMRVEVEVLSRIEAFLDFKVVDAQLAEVVSPFDHAMLLYVGDPLLPILQDMKFRVYAFGVEPTTEVIANHVFSRMLNEKWFTRRVTVYETDKYSATVVR